MFKYIKGFFNIEKWTYRELLIFLGIFLLLNLLAPRGFVQWVLIQQDIRRVKVETQETLRRTEILNEEIRRFQSSRAIKEQKLRELGYLKTDELSLEFVAPNRQSKRRETPQEHTSQPAR